jgi:hypothetical protein
MKKILFLLFLGINAQAQTTLPNLDFENWTLSTSGRYEDPSPTTTWATPNYAMDLILGNPASSIVQKSTDAHGGSYAALMKSRNIVGNFVGATLFSGQLNTTVPFSPVPLLGMPFTGRPVALTGWYKYAPVGGDSSDIYIKLTKWNTATNTRDDIGYVEKRDYAAVSNYTQFYLPINYTSTQTPDSITIVFSASAGAEQKLGQVGSSLWIDDVVLDYTPTNIQSTTTNTHNIHIYPNPFIDVINITADDEIESYQIINYTGQVVTTQTMQATQNNISLHNLAIGNYTLVIYNKAHQAIYQQTITKK